MYHPLGLVSPNFQKYFNFNKKWNYEEVNDVNQWTGFYMIRTSVIKELISKELLEFEYFDILLPVRRNLIPKSNCSGK